MAGRKRKSKSKRIIVPSRLMSELQSTIAFTCYDNDQDLKTGKSNKIKVLKQKMLQLYMPPFNLNDDRISYVELILSGRGVFKYLFDCEINHGSVDDDNNPDCREKLVLSPIFLWNGQCSLFCWSRLYECRIID